jgi:septum formation protein
VIVSEIDETPQQKESPKQMVKRLCVDKAKAVAAQIKDLDSFSKSDLWIIAADTTVVSPRGRNLGKPVDRREALAMVKEISGKTHSVLTGYCILKMKNGKILKTLEKVIRTQVTLRPLSSAEIKDYVDSGESMDKAGAYAAQGKGMTLIQKISGSYTNVVGLPIAEVLFDLKKLGFRP